MSKSRWEAIGTPRSVRRDLCWFSPTSLRILHELRGSRRRAVAGLLGQSTSRHWRVRRSPRFRVAEAHADTTDVVLHRWRPVLITVCVRTATHHVAHGTQTMISLQEPCWPRARGPRRVGQLAQGPKLTVSTHAEGERIARLLGLEPLPEERGLFRWTYASAPCSSPCTPWWSSYSPDSCSASNSHHRAPTDATGSTPVGFSTRAAPRKPCSRRGGL